MNYDNLHELINRYEAKLDMTMDNVRHEQMKWEAMKIFRDVWFSDEAANMPFSVMFNKARKGCGWMIDNSRISPTSGVVKMAEIEPETVEHLFREVLFADDHGSVEQQQRNMDEFVDGIEALRLKLFPKKWKYKHDRHAASCYLSFYAPEKNYVYRFSDADLMAKYIGFDKNIGMGQYFNLSAYYEMCDIIVEALKLHPTLLAAHEARLNENCYRDDSLHLMAFDLMYCCRTYRYYHGLTAPEFVHKASKSKTTKLAAAKEQKRQQLMQSIAEAQDKLLTLQMQLADYEYISLIGITVSTKTYGEGVIIDQTENKVCVRFSDVTKTFVIHRKYPRPTFEDDENIVDLFSDRYDIQKQIETINKSIVRETAALDALD